jgi:hypothetical protein
MVGTSVFEIIAPGHETPLKLNAFELAHLE